MESKIYNFDQIIDRKNTNSLKYDFAVERGKPHDVLPLWVADMDFKAPREVLDELAKTARHGVFGYSDVKPAYFDTIQKWFMDSFGWQTKREWLVKTPGVVFAICTAIRALTEPGDTVMIERPVYYPFSLSILQNNRKLVNSPLIYKNGAYTIDFADVERRIIESKVKLFILCSPHNPVGRVWSEAELRRLGDILCKHNVFVIADEIHQEFTFDGYRHHVFADLAPAYNDRTITCTAPSKTFNLAGLQVSNIFIANPEIRRKFTAAMAATGYVELNAMGIAAAQAAYGKGRPWLKQLKHYLSQNLEFAEAFLTSRLPEIKLVKPQGTYLLWLDCAALGLTEEALEKLIVRRAKLWLDAGTMFGPEGAQFERINIACPRPVLQRALEQLERAIRS